MNAEKRLDPAVQEVIKKSNAERIDFIQSDKWIGYSAAKGILADLENLLNCPPRQRKRFLLITAKSGNGKTTLLKRFYKVHPPTRIDGTVISPVIMIEGPAGPSVDDFYSSILFELGAPLAPTTFGKKLQLKRLLPRVNCKMLLIDNFHDFKFGNSDLKKKYLAAVRKLATDTAVSISIVATSTHIARNVIEGDAQMYSRFKFKNLPTWKNDDEFRSLLYAFERTLPLKKHSNLVSEKLMNRILIMSEGLIANIEEILQEAAEMAIVTERERIDEEILKSIAYNRKHEREPLEKKEYSSDYYT